MATDETINSSLYATYPYGKIYFYYILIYKCIDMWLQSSQT